MTVADLRRALEDCYAPASRLNIVAAALIRDLTLTRDTTAPGATIPGVPPRFHAHVHLTAPAADQDTIAIFRAHVENRLLGLAWISHATVTVHPPLLPILR